MKEFEKWRNKQEISNLSGRSYKADARVWRAALEYIKREALYRYPSQPKYMGDIIEQELES